MEIPMGLKRWLLAMALIGLLGTMTSYAVNVTNSTTTTIINITSTSTTSSTTTINVMSLTLTPNRTAIDIGESVLFANAVSGGAAPYHFFYNSSDWPNTLETNNTFTFPVPGNFLITLQAQDNSTLNMTTANATIYVNSTLGITLQPYNATIVSGQNEILIANAVAGTPPYKFQWFNATCITNNTISNATAATFNTPPISAIQNFCVQVTDATNETANIITSVTPQAAVQTSGGYTVMGSGGSGVYNPQGTETLSPTMITEGNETTVYNLTPGSIFTATFCGANQKVIEGSISPNQTQIELANVLYTITLKVPRQINSYEPNCWAELLNVSWIPMVHTETLEFSLGSPIVAKPPATTTTTPVTTTTPTTTLPAVTTIAVTTIPALSTVPTTTVYSANILSAPITPGNNAGVIAAAIIVIILILVVVWYAFIRKPPSST